MRTSSSVLACDTGNLVPTISSRFESIREYIAADSPVYAELVVERLVRAVERLQAFPQSGRLVPELNTLEIREIIVKPYRLVYRLREGKVQVVTVFRASRLLTGFS